MQTDVCATLAAYRLAIVWLWGCDLRSVLRKASFSDAKDANRRCASSSRSKFMNVMPMYRLQTSRLVASRITGSRFGQGRPRSRLCFRALTAASWKPLPSEPAHHCNALLPLARGGDALEAECMAVVKQNRPDGVRAMPGLLGITGLAGQQGGADFLNEMDGCN